MASPKKKDSVETPVTEKKDSRSYLYAVGRRKTAVAKVRLLQNGKGNFLVNGQKVEEYFFGTLLQKVLQPFKVLGVMKQYDIVAEVVGGGVAGQADAVCHAISRALSLTDEGSRTMMKRAGFLTRDARVKERKKYGLKKARRSPQWSKR